MFHILIASHTFICLFTFHNKNINILKLLFMVFSDFTNLISHFQILFHKKHLTIKTPHSTKNETNIFTRRSWPLSNGNAESRKRQLYNMFWANITQRTWQFRYILYILAVYTIFDPVSSPFIYIAAIHICNIRNSHNIYFYEMGLWHYSLTVL